jgi:NAD(P)-dependent dehydrogenase (short-subunit alcohol dehydrogenase family)
MFTGMKIDMYQMLVNISTAAAHFNPAGDHGIYGVSKASFAHMLQFLSDEVPVEQCQILSCHPGRIFTEGAVAAGYTKDSIPWDSGGFSVKPS